MPNAPVVLNRANFKAGLERVINDQQFGQQLEARPGTALRSIGVELPDDLARELDSRPLSKTIENSFGPSTARPRPEILPAVVVFVAVQVVVNTRVIPPKKPQVEQALDEAITKAADLASGEISLTD
jgi:hypothetical protein